MFFYFDYLILQIDNNNSFIHPLQCILVCIHLEKLYVHILAQIVKQ